MDSDDERGLEQENKRLENKRGWQIPLVYVKLFQEEEEEAKKEAYEDCLDRRQRYRVAVDWLSQCPSEWRVRRFLDTIRGFHEGRLDLRGRSRSRYLSYRRKLAAFLQDTHELRQHVAMAERSAELPFTPLHLSKQMFQDKYKMHGIIYEELFEAADRAEAYFEGPGFPRFQQLFLLDLPPEVIQLIVKFCHSNESYQVAATCRVLRRVFWDVASKSLKLINNFSDRSQSYRNQVYGMQRRFLDDCDAILMYMLLSRGLRELVIRDSWDRSSGLITTAEVTAAEQRELRGELLSRLELVVARARATNLVILGLQSVTLSWAMLRAIAAMPRLRILRMIQCEFPTRSPDAASTDTEHVEFPSIASFVLCPHPSFHSVVAFELLYQLPNVRAITFTGPTTRGSLKTENLARLNVLRTTERLTIICWADDDLTRVHRWLRAACNNLDGALRLTHLKIGDGDELGHGIPLDVMRDLFIALRGTPLQTLALQGVAGVCPGLFTTIAAAFPSLTALTMIYRRATSRVFRGLQAPPLSRIEHSRRRAQSGDDIRLTLGGGELSLRMHCVRLHRGPLDH
ncbi:hypothetical protein DAEQUDRAFT_503459 [Daedalea quercina L-15889]|uniref:F-box domain-containing protein n=1 Tax=Daedalea quercina L-15889 TaxID=1314783 RepID=A0A165T7E3_9APHY|nr:hypothetical protein DAEQUDRAFT_503459 [Daedalea quercina L-15889]